MSTEVNGGHPAMDYAQHRATYSGFIRLIQVSIVSLAILLAGMAFFLV